MIPTPLLLQARLPRTLAPALAVCLAAVLTGCPPTDDRTTAGELLIIDPETISIDEPVGLFHLRAIAAHPDEQGTWYGEAHFEGDVELSGRYFDLQLDPEDLGPTNPCFEVDDDHARHLPRFPGDDRRTWFCFTDADHVVETLGEPTQGGRLTSVVITQYHYIYEQTDVINRATIAPDVDRDRGHVLPDHAPGHEPEPSPADRSPGT